MQRLQQDTRADAVLLRIADIAACASLPLAARHEAAAVLNIWDRAWRVERLLWIAVYKPSQPSAPRGIERLHATMIASIMRHYMLVGGGKKGSPPLTTNVAG